MEEQCDDSSPMLRMNYVRISKLIESGTHPREDLPRTPNLESDCGPKKLVDIPEPELLSSEVSQALDPRLGQGSDLNPPTHPSTSDLTNIRQQSQEMVHHFWARFILIKNKVKDCRDEDAISLFCKNCTDEGILNSIHHRQVSHFADLATIVQKYYAMESAWKLRQPLGSYRFPQTPRQTKRVYPRMSPDPITKKSKPVTGRGTVLEGWLDRPCKIHTTPDTVPTHSLRACWILR